MIIDASAVLAILLGRKRCGHICQGDRERRGSTHLGSQLLEAALVIDNRGDAVARREFDRFFERAAITIEPVTPEQARIAREAYRDFGKGRHRAALNFGDCLTYALARVSDQPLLYKGRDFSRTDLQSALKQ